MMASSKLPVRSFLPSISSLLCACALLAGLGACAGDPLDEDVEFRSSRLELESLEPGQCLALDPEITTVVAEASSADSIIEDNFLLAEVFEDDVILRVAGPAQTEGELLIVAEATLIPDDPELDDDCGFCDGICVDGKCYMGPPPYTVRAEGICND